MWNARWCTHDELYLRIEAGEGDPQKVMLIEGGIIDTFTAPKEFPSC